MSKDDSVSRRKFIKTGAMGVGALSLAAVDSIAQSAEKQENTETNRSPREVVVLSASMERIEPDDDRIKKLVNRLDIGVSNRPDIICLPETFVNDMNSPETVPGPITDTFSAYAKKNNCYIICPLIRKNGSDKFNTAVLINRQGDLVGMYDKIHCTEAECDNSVVPGNIDPLVFKTDFGTIGIQICFDVNWMDQWRALRQKGAEIVFWPSAYVGGRMLSAYASLFNYYVVGSSLPGPSIIYDTAGDVITTSGKFEKWALATLNLEKIHCEIDFHVKKTKEIRKKYGRKVAIKFYHDEDWVIIESRSADLPIKQIVEEFGIVGRHDYINRATAHNKKFR